MDSFTNWHDAHREAVEQATRYQREMGLEKATEYDRTVYRVKMLPKADCRFGWELRCEVVRPGD